jgi:outer membrane protein TolC
MILRPCLALALAALPAASQEALTLPAALHRAATASLQADLASLARASAREDRNVVESAYWPEIRLQGGHLNTDEDTLLRTSPMSLGPFPVLGSITVPSMDQGVAQKSSWRYDLTASLLVYDFGKRGSAMDATRAKESAVDLRGREEVSRAQAEVASRFVSVVNILARRKVVDQRRQALQDHLKDARALYDQGVVARNDLLRTEVALRAVDDAGRTLDNALVTAREGLAIALGQDPRTPLSVPDALPQPPEVPWSEAEVRSRAAGSNAGVKALESRVRAAEGQTEMRRKDFTPDIVAQVGHDYQQDRFLVHEDQTSLYLGLSWKIFDGGARSAKLSQARAEASTARRELLDARRQAENAAATALRTYQESLEEMKTAQANVEAAQENLRIVTDQYQQAYAKSADVLDAETVLAESRFSLSDRLCRAYATQAALLAILGEDLEAFYSKTNTER